MTITRRIAVLERALAGGEVGWDWNDDDLRRHVRRVALEHGLDEGTLFAESVKVLEFARDRRLAVGSPSFTEAWAAEVGDDPMALAAYLEQARRQEAQNRP